MTNMKSETTVKNLQRKFDFIVENGLSNNRIGQKVIYNYFQQIDSLMQIHKEKNKNLTQNCLP
jgi:hypothetical protein